MNQPEPDYDISMLFQDGTLFKGQAFNADDAAQIVGEEEHHTEAQLVYAIIIRRTA